MLLDCFYYIHSIYGKKESVKLLSNTLIITRSNTLLIVNKRSLIFLNSCLKLLLKVIKDNILLNITLFFYKKSKPSSYLGGGLLIHHLSNRLQFSKIISHKLNQMAGCMGDVSLFITDNCNIPFNSRLNGTRNKII